MSSKLFKDDKTYRNFATELYPESGDIELLKSTCDKPFIISPLHCCDLKEEYETLDKNELSNLMDIYKKPHYHILFVNCQLKGSTINKLLDKYNFVGGEPVKDRDGYIRYLIHKGFDNKFQYDKDDLWWSDKVNLNIENILDFDSPKNLVIVNEMSGYTTKYKMKVGELEDLQNKLFNWEIPICRLRDIISVGQWVTYCSKIKEMIKFRNSFNDVERPDELLVFYVTGGSECGKSWFIKHYLKPYLKDKFGWTSATCNGCFDNYNEQDILYLTELRGNEHSMSELCRLLDTTVNSPIHRRYYDVSSYFLKCVIIDSLETVDTIYESLDKDSQFDGKHQLRRRIDCTFTMTHDKDTDVYNVCPVINERSNVKDKVTEIVNDVCKMYGNDKFVTVSDSDVDEITSMFS